MKRISIILFFSLLFSNYMFAGNRDKFLSLNTGLYFSPKTRLSGFSTTLSFEKELQYRSFLSFSLRGNGYSSTPIDNKLYKHIDLSIILSYKKNIYTGKNTIALLMGGGHLGFGSKGFQGGGTLGLEYDLFLSNRCVLFLSQENFLTFHSSEIFTSGINIGLKIPLSR